MLLAILWTCAVLAAIAGWKAGSLSKRTATIVAGVCCVVLVAGAYVSGHEAWIPEALVTPIMVYLQSSWFGPPAVMLFAIAATQGHDAPGGKRRTGLLAGLTLIVLLAASNGLLFKPDNLNQAGDEPLHAVDPNGVVRQSTGYTCASAASATLLRRLNIDPAATEYEMVPLCMTKRWGGATTLGTAVGLKRKAEPQGWRVRIVEADWDTLIMLRKPMMCAVKYDAMVDHAVVLCGIDAQQNVQIADPMNGLVNWSRDEFLQRYRGEVIVVFKDDPMEL
jgi:predicted double-glycine peptidase